MFQSAIMIFMLSLIALLSAFGGAETLGFF